MIKALELFSGIGAFAEAAPAHKIEVIAAFDQDPRANATYFANHGMQPKSRNLDTVKANELVSADLWWMSPPCQPYSVRGNQKGLQDPRSASLVNLLNLLPFHRPQVLLLENVSAFRGSDAHQLCLKVFEDNGYTSQFFELSPTDFGIPMRRPRLYLVATAGSVIFKAQDLQEFKVRSIWDFVEPSYSEDLLVAQSDYEKYAKSLHIIEPGDAGAYAICFTSGYWKSFKSSGTFIRVGDRQIRRFSPQEIVALMGFSSEFAFPGQLTMSAKLKLAGNTVDVRAIDFLLQGITLSA